MDKERSAEARAIDAARSAELNNIAFDVFFLRADLGGGKLWVGGITTKLGVITTKHGSVANFVHNVLFISGGCSVAQFA